MPTATDLVTDLPADFEVFGQAVATSMADLLGGTTGQILAKNSATDMDFVWVTNDVGDITAVTAGTGISGGGTSGAVTITNSMATEITAKGDLIVGTGNATFDNLPAGTNGHVLTADSTVSPSGLKWAAPASGTTFAGAQATNNGGTFSYTSSVATALPFPTENFDTNSFHDTSTNTTRLTIPTGGGGKYLFTGTGIFIGTVPSYAWIMVYKNGAVISDGIAYGGRIGAIIGNANAPVGGSVVLSAVAGDYFELFIQSDQSTGTKNIYGSFSCSFLGA